MVREEEERPGGAEFLALEQHRRARAQQQQSRHGPEPAGAASAVAALAATRVGDLIVVFEKGDERDGGRSRAGVPRRFFCHV